MNFSGSRPWFFLDLGFHVKFGVIGVDLVFLSNYHILWLFNTSNYFLTILTDIVITISINDIFHLQSIISMGLINQYCSVVERASLRLKRAPAIHNVIFSFRTSIMKTVELVDQMQQVNLLT